MLFNALKTHRQAIKTAPSPLISYQLQTNYSSCTIYILTRVTNFLMKKKTYQYILLLSFAYYWNHFYLNPPLTDSRMALDTFVMTFWTKSRVGSTIMLGMLNLIWTSNLLTGLMIKIRNDLRKNHLNRFQSFISWCVRSLKKIW